MISYNYFLCYNKNENKKFMKIKNIYIGSWFPKIRLHLNEFKDFLKDGSVNPELDKKTAKTLFNKVRPQNIKLGTTSKGLAEINAQNSKGFDFAYYEDGLLLLKAPVKDFRNDRGKMVDFYQNTLTPCLAFVFSRGAKGLEIIRLPKLAKKIFITTINANKPSIEKFLDGEKEVIDEWQNLKQFSLIFSENLVIINLKKAFSNSQIDEIAQELIFHTEINRHFYWLLQTHRYIWEEAESVLGSKGIKAKDIPEYVENMTRYYRNVVNINSRIDQMSVVLNTRKQGLKYLADKKWHDYFTSKFKKTELEAQYIKKLFLMTSNYLKNNVSYLSSVYQELSEESIRKLQFLFLVNVISSFLILGTLFGANIYLYSQGEIVAYGNIQSFKFSVLISFGFLTLLLSSIIYYFWNNIYKNLTRRVKK